MAKKNENKTQYYLDYCSESVRKLDYEHYFCLMFLKPKPRAANLAIRAFNIETATIKDTVSRPELGLLRMAFWRDTIDLIYKVSSRLFIGLLLDVTRCRINGTVLLSRINL
jgi:phytoene/squalene synthetase